jgi:hypothetical protein
LIDGPELSYDTLAPPLQTGFLISNRGLIKRLQSMHRRTPERAPQRHPAADADATQQQARLCGALLRALEGGAPATAGAALDGGAWAAALEAPDVAQQRLARLRAEEAGLLRQLDELMGDPGAEWLLIFLSSVGDAPGISLRAALAPPFKPRGVGLAALPRVTRACPS